MELVNPFKALRERKGLTLHALSVRAGVSRYLIIRTEQGCFPTPPPRLLSYVVGYLNGDELEILEDYAKFQVEVRKRNSRLLNTFPVGAPENQHPFTYWRTHAENGPFNLTEVSKRLCVAQPVLYHFEHKPRQQGSIPSQLLLALEQAGYTLDELNELKVAYDNYRRYLREAPKGLATA